MQHRVDVVIPPTGFLPLVGGVLTGALSISPPGPMSFLPGVSQQNPIFMSKTSWTGTTARTGQFGYMNWIDIVSDDAFLDDSGASAFRITHNYGGGTQFAGGRVGLSVTMYQVTGATGTFPKDTNQQRIAIQAQVHAAENASGTSSTDPAGVSGSIYSIAGYTRLFGPGSVVDGQGVSHPVSGATNYNDCIGMNMNMRVETGASCYAKEFIHLAQEFQDQTQGSVSDACIMIANQPGAIGWKNIMALGRPNGAWPLSLDGTGKVFGTYRGTGLARMQAGYGIDWRDISFNTAAIATPGFVVDGFGNTGISALSLATSGQTTTVDANRIHVLSATVVTSTGTWGPSMGMYDASGNQWAVGTTDASRNLLTVTLVAPAYITGAPPANPVTVIANSGSAAQATLNLTWSTSPGTLALQPSGGATVFGGPVTLPAGSTGAFLPLAGGTITAPDATAALTINASNTPSTQAALTVNATNIQTTADHHYNRFTATVDYTADSPGGDNLGFASYMVMRPNGHNVFLSGHTCAIYGNAFLGGDGNAASHCSFLSGVMGASGSNGPGILDKAVDFYGHPDYNTGGGTLTTHYFLFQAPSTAATNEYGAYFTAPVSIGVDPPSYNLDIYCPAGGNVSATNALRVQFTGGVGNFVVRSTGTTVNPGYAPGAGGFGAMDIVVGNGSAERYDCHRRLYVSVVCRRNTYGCAGSGCARACPDRGGHNWTAVVVFHGWRMA